MKLLLDTHAFLWWIDDPLLLAEAARLEIGNPRNAVFVSAVCIQEIVLKQSRDRLRCQDPILPLVGANRFTPLPVTLDHAQAVRELPPLHKDPFDRQLIAQGLTEGMTVVTRDTMFAKYGVTVVWA
jgi:PIN domain nuclease of toxin-antitoxin system